MTGQHDSPVADDDFPEFAEPPRHRPPPSHHAEGAGEDDATDNGQDQVDDLLARLRRERDEGKR